MPITQKQATQVIEEFKQWGAYREDRMVAAIDFVQNCTTLESFDSPRYTRICYIMSLARLWLLSRKVKVGLLPIMK
tara:strand:+ start:295 stop:522 length:228 start_codon:yes stop_codon:yes gene_type:complete